MPDFCIYATGQWDFYAQLAFLTIIVHIILHYKLPSRHWYINADRSKKEIDEETYDFINSLNNEIEGSEKK